MCSELFLSGINAVILEQGLGKARAQILCKQLENHGGAVEKTLTKGTTHILVGKTTRLSRLPNLLKVESIPESVLVLRADWLSACLVQAKVVGHGAYVVHPEPSPTASPSKDSSQVPPSGKASQTLPAVASSPLKEEASPSQAAKMPPSSTSTKEAATGESKSADSSPSKKPTTPTKPVASLTSPKVHCFIHLLHVLIVL